jgi:hypothetical protein
MPLAPESRGIRASADDRASGMNGITQKSVGSNLLVIGTNSIRSVFVGTREFLAIMVRVLFSWGWPTRCSMVNYFAEKVSQGQRESKFSSTGATNVPSPSSFSHVPIVDSPFFRPALDAREYSADPTDCHTKGLGSRPRLPHFAPSLASPLRPYPSKVPSTNVLKVFPKPYNAFDHHYGIPGHQSPQSPHHTTQYFRKLSL